MYLNKAFIIGNLTRDPELRSLPSGVKVTTFGIATNRVWNDREGNRQEATEFHNIVVFGRPAETTAQYLRKGSMALIEGRMQTRSWEADDGTKRYRTEIVADRVQFGPRSAGGGSGGPSSAKASEGGTKSPEIDTIEYPDAESEGVNPDDIPF